MLKGDIGRFCTLIDCAQHALDLARSVNRIATLVTQLNRTRLASLIKREVSLTKTSALYDIYSNISIDVNVLLPVIAYQHRLSCKRISH